MHKALGNYYSSLGKHEKALASYHKAKEYFLQSNDAHEYANASYNIGLIKLKKGKYDDDDMKVSIENGLVAKVSKLIEADKSSAESPGLALVHGVEAISAVKKGLGSLVSMPKHRDSFWLEMFNYLAEKGVPVYPWEFDGNKKWQEIDFHMDIRKAREFLRIRV